MIAEPKNDDQYRKNKKTYTSYSVINLISKSMHLISMVARSKLMLFAELNIRMFK